jgi:hypothetical protein
MKKTFVPFYLLLGLVHILYAQNPDLTVKTKIKAFSWGGNMTNLYYQSKVGMEPMKVNLFTSRMSDSLSYEGSQNSTFFTVKKNKDGTFKKTNVAKFKLLLDSKDQLLIVFKNNRGLSKVLVYPNDLDLFKRGQMRFYNFTTQNVAMKINDNFYPSLPMESMILNYPNSERNAAVEISEMYPGDSAEKTNSKHSESTVQAKHRKVSDAIQIGVHQDGKWKSAFRSSMSRNPLERIHFFIFPYRDKYHKVQYISERIVESSNPSGSNIPKALKPLK